MVEKSRTVWKVRRDTLTGEHVGVYTHLKEPLDLRWHVPIRNIMYPDNGGKLMCRGIVPGFECLGVIPIYRWWGAEDFLLWYGDGSLEAAIDASCGRRYSYRVSPGVLSGYIHTCGFRVVRR